VSPGAVGLEDTELDRDGGVVGQAGEHAPTGRAGLVAALQAAACRICLGDQGQRYGQFVSCADTWLGCTSRSVLATFGPHGDDHPRNTNKGTP
jgi:hypothetical protein